MAPPMYKIFENLTEKKHSHKLSYKFLSNYEYKSIHINFLKKIFKKLGS